MQTLFIANKNYSSWSLRPWVLMRELGIPFHEELVPFGGNERFATFRSFSPNGKVPCLQDGDVTVWDSYAICEYLADSNPAVWAHDTAARAWARSASAEMHSGFPALRDFCSMNCGVRVQVEAFSAAVLLELERIDQLWREGLGRFGGPFLAGASFTAVDAFFAPVAFRVQTYGAPQSGPAREYAARLLALPSMDDWYQAALLEPWRDEAHEADLRKSGAVVLDLRRRAG